MIEKHDEHETKRKIFNGFPKELHQLKYEAISVPQGSVDLSKRHKKEKSSTCYLLITTKQVYEDSVLSRAQVFRWFKAFSKGRESIEDELRRRRPSVSKIAENVVRVRDLVRSDRRLTVRMIEEELNLNHTTVHQIFSNELKMTFDGDVNFLMETTPKISLSEILKAIELPFSLLNKMSRIVIDDSVIEFLEKYSNQLVTLSFIYCAVRDGKSRSKFKNLRCDNLKTLDVMNSDIASLFAILPNVTELKLRISFDLSDYVLSDLNKCLFKLETLLFYNTVSFEEEVHRRFHAVETLENHSSPQAFNFLGIKFLIEKYRTTLRDVDFTFLRLSSEALLSISEIEGLKLRSILFPRNLHSNYIHKFCKMQSSLIQLDLSFLLHDTDFTVIAVCKCLPNLQELIIRENQTIDQCIIKIFQLQNLVKLDAFGCMNISESSYQEAVSNLKTFKLKYLNLYFTKIRDDSLFKLLKCNQNIRYLDASGIRVSDETLNMICQNLIFLEYLILFSCPTISDSGLTGEFENYSDAITPTPLSNLKYLKVLSFSFNSLITNQGCIKAIRFRKLADLSLIACLETEKLSFAYTKELQHCKAAFTPRQPASCVERLAHRRFHLGRNEVSDRLDAQRLTLTALV
ncbi:HTH_48 domain-containing protein [Trichonephila clavipes]|nr:HTH_48 domain-containing protein [Trichonephila clavipes]